MTTHTRAALVRRTFVGLASIAAGAALIHRMVEVDHKHSSLLIWLGIGLLAYGGYHVSQRVTESFMDRIVGMLSFWKRGA